MKRIFLSLFWLGLTQATFAQFDLSLNANYARPQGVMNRYIQNAWGGSGQALYRIRYSPFAIGAEIGVSGYGSQTTRQTYRFNDGSATETDVCISSQFATFMLVSRIDVLRDNIITPYINVKAGYHHYWTSLNIADPTDTDGCRPLENTSLLKDGAFAGTLGAGVRWDVSSLFKQVEKGLLAVDFSVNYTEGGNVRYMNVNIPTNPDPVSHHHVATNTDGSQPFNSRFINPQNQVVHEHHVGNVYRSAIQQLDFRLGFLLRLP